MSCFLVRLRPYCPSDSEDIVSKIRPTLALRQWPRLHLHLADRHEEKVVDRRGAAYLASLADKTVMDLEKNA